MVDAAACGAVFDDDAQVINSISRWPASRDCERGYVVRGDDERAWNQQRPLRAIAKNNFNLTKVLAISFHYLSISQTFQPATRI